MNTYEYKVRARGRVGTAIFAASLLLAAFCGPAFADEYIEKISGPPMNGTVVSVSRDSVRVMLDNGMTMAVPRSQVASIHVGDLTDEAIEPFLDLRNRANEVTLANQLERLLDCAEVSPGSAKLRDYMETELLPRDPRMMELREWESVDAAFPDSPPLRNALARARAENAATADDLVERLNALREIVMAQTAAGSGFETAAEKYRAALRESLDDALRRGDFQRAIQRFSELNNISPDGKTPVKSPDALRQRLDRSRTERLARGLNQWAPCVGLNACDLLPLVRYLETHEEDREILAAARKARERCIEAALEGLYAEFEESADLTGLHQAKADFIQRLGPDVRRPEAKLALANLDSILSRESKAAKAIESLQTRAESEEVDPAILSSALAYARERHSDTVVWRQSAQIAKLERLHPDE